MSITLKKARLIIRKTFEKAREMELKPLTVIVLDAGGNVLAFERDERAAPGRFEIARGKAYGVVMMGVGGEALMARAEAQAYFIGAANAAYGGKLIPVPGGILIRDGRGRVIGSIGVTGDSSENDALAGKTGIEAAGLTAET